MVVRILDLGFLGIDLRKIKLRILYEISIIAILFLLLKIASLFDPSCKKAHTIFPCCGPIAIVSAHDRLYMAASITCGGRNRKKRKTSG